MNYVNDTLYKKTLLYERQDTLQQIKKLKILMTSDDQNVEKSQAKLIRMNRKLLRIDAALVRLDKGEYGVCHACQAPIRDDRLQLLPFAELCIRCQRKQENLSSF